MIKGKFLITTEKEGIITNKGIRAFVMEKILNSSLQKGTAINIDEKSVEIQLEGEREKIEAFVKKLKKELVENFGNPTIKFTEFKEDSMLEISEILRSSQALTIGQLQKGISVQLDILNALKDLNILKELPKKQAETLAVLKELPERLAQKLKTN